MSDSVRRHRRQPTRLPCPWDSPGKNAGVGCHFLLQCMKVKSESEVTQLCPTLCNPTDCSPPGSSTHGIFQARVLEWGAIAFSQSPYASLKSSMPARWLGSQGLVLVSGVVVWWGQVYSQAALRPGPSGGGAHHTSTPFSCFL